MKLKRKVLLMPFLLLGASLSITMPLVACGNRQFNKLVKELKQHPEYQGEEVDFNGYAGAPSYKVYAHNDDVIGKLRSRYVSGNQINELIKIPNLTITTEEKHGHTFIPAADVDSSQGTNYDAIWVRDSIWGYYALQKQNEALAKKVLLSQLDYFACATQKQRIKNICDNPKLIDDPVNGQMNAVHIRFNADSEDFEDVQENGKAQSWNHKQNDALGLFLGAFLDAVNEGEIVQSDLNDNCIDAIVGLFEYLYKVKFWQMEDSGAWEEPQRLNTSSVGIVTSAVQKMLQICEQPSTWFLTSFYSRANTLGYEDLKSENARATLTDMSNQGLSLVKKQIELGGESPTYPTNDKRYRTADAALLNLIYPITSLSGLGLSEKEKIFDIVSTLKTDWGVKRYNNDTYQAGNFWFNQIKTDTDSESNKKREEDFIAGSEASWFFDSWMAYDAVQLAKEDTAKADYYKALATMHFNRSLAFITGKGLHGDGTDCQAGSLPESYNAIVDGKNWWRVPSPIDPLNWAKSSFILMSDVISEII